MKTQTLLTTRLALGLTCVLSVACKGESSVTEYADDADLVAAVSGNSVSEILISAGLVIDSNEFRHTERKAWFAKNSVGLEKLNSQVDSKSNAGCKLTVQDQQVPKVLVLNNDSAYPMPQGRIIYCKDTKLSWAIQDAELTATIDELGIEPEESERIEFYRVPLDAPNTFSYVTSSGVGSVVIYEGLLKAFDSNSLDSESALRGALLNEIGVVHQLRKDNQRNVQTLYEKARATCIQKLGLENLSENEKIGYCRKNLSLNSKSVIYASDDFAAKVIGRKKYGTGFRPTEFSKYIRMMSSAGRDTHDPHPDSTERAIRLENAFKNLGIDLSTGGLLMKSQN